MSQQIEIFDNKFRLLHENSSKIIKKISNEKLFWQPLQKNVLFPINSCGEYIIRSAGKIEQTFGGITTRLWDDPFEWTLPEKLSTKELILDYLGEVEITRQKGFEYLKTDEDLEKTLPAPVKIISLFELILDTLTTAQNFQGRAIAIFQLISDEKII